MTPEEKLASYISAFGPDSLPAEVAQRARQVLMAVVGTAIAGAGEDGCAELAALLLEEGGAEQATILVRGGRLPAAKAALVNGAMARALDFCDAIPPGLHAGSSVVPVAFAVAELRGKCSGREFLDALVLGLEIATRMNLTEAMYDGFDPTGVAVVFGSTAVAARLLELSPDQTLHALALAFNRAGGSFQSNVDGSLAVRVIQGWVAETGITCALFARAGITGPRHFLTGVYGYCHLFGRDRLVPEQIVGDLGERWAMLETAFKKFPSCGLTQAVTELAEQAIRHADITSGTVAAVRIYLPPYAYRLVGHPFRVGENPRVNAQFSAQYCVANVIHRRGSALRHFTPEQVASPELADLLARISVHSEPALDARGHTAVDLAIELVDGTTHKSSLDCPFGTPSAPLSEENHRQRFRDCLDYGAGTSSANLYSALTGKIDGLEDLADISELIEALTLNN